MDNNNSKAELVAELERLSGHQIRSREDILSYLEQLSQKAAAKTGKWQGIKTALLLTLLVFSAMQYYFIDVQLQILSQTTLTVFVPVNDGSAPKVYFGG